MFKNLITTDTVYQWLTFFQKCVNKICNSEDIIFTAEIWRPGSLSKKAVNNEVSVVTSKTFPFLYMELFWNTRGKLRFKVYMKPNQQLKCLNQGSCHINHCFKAISWGVFGRLSWLTSRTKTTKKSRIDELYLDHTAALEKAKLYLSPFLTFRDAFQDTDA